MSVTIYSVVPKRLIEDARAIEKHAEDQLEAWLALGQSEKYSKAIDQARILRLAANEKDVYTRREILKNAGFTVKNLHKNRKENPTMKKASPAQLAARKRFAEMARSGAFKKTAKRKTNPATIQYIVFSELSPQKYKQMLVTENKQRAISVADVNQMDGYHSVVEDQVGHLIYDAKTRKGYLQSNPSKRKANPMTETVIWGLAPGESRDYMEEIMYGGGQKLTKEQIDKVIAAATAAGYHSFRIGGIDMTQKPDFAGALNVRKKRKTNPAKKTVSQKVSQLVHEGYPQRQAVAVALSEQRAGKVKRNPGKVKYRNLATDLKGDQRVGYAVHMADRPSYQAIAWFTKKPDAMKVAQEAADRTGKQLAVTRVQNYFGAM